MGPPGTLCLEQRADSLAEAWAGKGSVGRERGVGPLEAAAGVVLVLAVGLDGVPQGFVVGPV